MSSRIVCSDGVRGRESGFLLPFDSLLLPLSAKMRYEVAAWYDFGIMTATDSELKGSRSQSFINRGSDLRLGFISYDFNDHPTAHLVEGLFRGIRDIREAPKVSVLAYCYGNHDSSPYRQNLVQAVDNFYNMKTMGFPESADLIRNDSIDILLDMQVHTLGNRMKILSYRPASIQVNYLVFPGTSGSFLLDYIIADRVVVPPEHAIFYTEALVLLPPTYQVSYYNATQDLKQYEKYYDKNDIVLCNYNKLDKLEPDTIQVWMNIMSAHPSTSLHLLMSHKVNIKTVNHNENQTVSNNIRKNSNYWGVQNEKISFVGRVDKAKHIRRHSECSLFLDSFVYGAHSTATDALKGGAPVITVEGDSFPSRVASSLLESITLDERTSNKGIDTSKILRRLSIKDFEDTVHQLIKGMTKYGSHSALSSIQREVLNWSNQKIGLFDNVKYSKSFLRAMEALVDLRAHYVLRSHDDYSSTGPKNRKHHIIAIIPLK